MSYEPFSRTVQGYTAEELDNDNGKVCPCCLSDGLSDEEIKPDGLCVECTECTECEKCGEWKIPNDMATEEYCCDCIEYLERENKAINDTNESLMRL